MLGNRLPQLTALSQKSLSEAGKLDSLLVNASPKKVPLTINDLTSIDKAKLFESILELPLTINPTQKNELSAEKLILELIFSLHRKNKSFDSLLNEYIFNFIQGILQKCGGIDSKLTKALRLHLYDKDFLIDFYITVFNRKKIKNWGSLSDKLEYATNKFKLNEQPSDQLQSIHCASTFYNILKRFDLITLNRYWEDHKEYLLDSLEELDVTCDNLRTVIEEDKIVSIEEIFIIIACNIETLRETRPLTFTVSISSITQSLITILNEISNELSETDLEQLKDSILGKIRHNVIANFIKNLNKKMHTQDLQAKFDFVEKYLEGKIKDPEFETPDIQKVIELNHIKNAVLVNDYLLERFYSLIVYKKYIEASKYFKNNTAQLTHDINHTILCSTTLFIEDKNYLGSVEKLFLYILLIPSIYGGLELKEELELMFNSMDKEKKIALKSKLEEDIEDAKFIDTFHSLFFGKEFNPQRMEHLRNYLKMITRSVTQDTEHLPPTNNASILLGSSSYNIESQDDFAPSLRDDNAVPLYDELSTEADLNAPVVVADELDLEIECPHLAKINNALIGKNDSFDFLQYSWISNETLLPELYKLQELSLTMSLCENGEIDSEFSLEELLINLTLNIAPIFSQFALQLRQFNLLIKARVEEILNILDLAELIALKNSIMEKSNDLIRLYANTPQSDVPIDRSLLDNQIAFLHSILNECEKKALPEPISPQQSVVPFAITASSVTFDSTAGILTSLNQDDSQRHNELDNSIAKAIQEALELPLPHVLTPPIELTPPTLPTPPSGLTPPVLLTPQMQRVSSPHYFQSAPPIPSADHEQENQIVSNANSQQHNFPGI